MKSFLTIISTLILFFITSNSAIAQTTVTGISYFTPISSEIQENKAGKTVDRRTVSGISVTDDPTHSMYFSSINCHGIILSTEMKSDEFGCHVCDVVDTEGDAIVYYSDSGKNNETNIRILGGSGKYKNIKGEGTGMAIGVTSDGKFGVKWEMTYTLE